MKIVFFGTSGFAVPSLKALAGSGHKVLLAVTQPDKKKGRHLRLAPPPLKEIATALDIPVFQPEDASDAESVERLRQLNADLFVVVSFGQILKRPLLDLPTKFSINLHASLLPKYRGAAPINWAIINGEKKTGVTVFKLEEGMDAGDIILDQTVDIRDEDNSVGLGERLSSVGAGVLINAVDLINKGGVVFKKQDKGLVSFAPKLKKSDGLLDWNLPALRLHNRVRGLLPWPSAFTGLNGRMLKILETKVIYGRDKAGHPGQIVGIEAEIGILVKTSGGCLAIRRLQLEGLRPMGFEEFLRGHRLEPGNIFGVI